MTTASRERLARRRLKTYGEVGYLLRKRNDGYYILDPARGLVIAGGDAHLGLYLWSLEDIENWIAAD